MITVMQFIDKDIALSVYEANSDAKILVSIEDVTQPENTFLSIDLTEREAVRLRDWLSESIEALKTPGD